MDQYGLCLDRVPYKTRKIQKWLHTWLLSFTVILQLRQTTKFALVICHPLLLNTAGTKGHFLIRYAACEVLELDHPTPHKNVANWDMVVYVYLFLCQNREHNYRIRSKLSTDIWLLQNSETVWNANIFCNWLGYTSLPFHGSTSSRSISPWCYLFKSNSRQEQMFSLLTNAKEKETH